MIRLIYSSIPEFKTLEFHKGLNILLADKHADSTKQDTRNRAGKSSLIEIIHFLLGSNIEIGSLFKNESFIDMAAAFSGKFGFGDGFCNEVTITRSCLKPNEVTIEGEYSKIADIKNENGLFAESQLFTLWTLQEWKNFLNRYWFNLPKQENTKKRDVKN